MQSLKEYFSVKNPKNERHRWLTGFWRYLRSPDAGHLKDRDRQAHASQVKKLLSTIDQDGSGISCIVEEGGQAVWKRYVEPLLESEKVTAGTIKSYLGSLEKFLQFVTCEDFKRKDMPAVPKQEEPIFRYVRNSLKGWRATGEKTQDKKWAKYIRECDDLLLPSNVHNLLSSPPAVKGLKAITAARDGSTLSSSQFFAARDLILASLCLQNGSRPGPMNNANLADYEGARREESSGKLVMLIAKHKCAQQGPAMLCTGNNLQCWLRTYVDHIRPNFAQPQEDALFVTSSGEAFPEATIGKRITAFYKKAGIHIDICVSSTKIRKMISSEVHSNEQ